MKIGVGSSGRWPIFTKRVVDLGRGNVLASGLRGCGGRLALSLVSSLYIAACAAKLDPVQALRYE